MRTVRFVVWVLAAALLVLPSTAGAATPTSAKRFGEAAAKARLGVVAQLPAVRRGTQDVLRRCYPALESAPQRVEERAGVVFGIAIIQSVFDPVLPSLRQLVVDLDAVPTRDRALRSGRAAWRQAVATFDRLPRLEDPCGALERWRAAGWSEEAAPPVPTLTEFERVTEGSGGRTLDRKFARAAKRLRRLGVSRRRAALFQGDAMFEKVFDDETLGLAGDR